MDSLFAVAINGSMLYVIASLTKEQCNEVSDIADSIHNSNQKSIDELFDEFIEAVRKELHIVFIKAPLQAVFRIR